KCSFESARGSGGHAMPQRTLPEESRAPTRKSSRMRARSARSRKTERHFAEQKWKRRRLYSTLGTTSTPLSSLPHTGSYRMRPPPQQTLRPGAVPPPCAAASPLRGQGARTRGPGRTPTPPPFADVQPACQREKRSGHGGCCHFPVDGRASLPPRLQAGRSFFQRRWTTRVREAVSNACGPKAVSTSERRAPS